MINLKIKEFEEIQKQKDLFDDKAIAEFLGVNRSTIWRIKRGKMVPGSEFIGAVLKAFPEKRFEDLFFVA